MAEFNQEWADEEWVTLSALQHWSYCPRQYALIFKEQTFQENYFTMKGRLAHERADTPGETTIEDATSLRALTVWSDRYGLFGKCDVVEIRVGNVPYPVEYKHGQTRASLHDEIQLCAQAMCLEEMFNVPVTTGAIYHISSRHRREVVLTRELRDQVIAASLAIREEFKRDSLPLALNDARCRDCSLQESCMPEINDCTEQNKTWLDRLPKEVIG